MLNKNKKIKYLCCMFLMQQALFATTSYVVTTTEDSTSSVPAGSLREAMLNVFFTNDSDFIITMQDNLGAVTLVDHLPVLSSYQSPEVTITVDGGIGNSIDGGGLYQAFFITPTHNNESVPTGTVTATIKNLTFNNCSVTGGDGQDGGGGAMGAGGAIFIDQGATVVGQSLVFINCSATGGGSQINTSTKSGGGGGGARGGLGGAAHANDTPTSNGAGGGGGFASSGGSATATINTMEGGGGGGANMLPGQGIVCDGGNYDMTSGTALAGGGGAMGGSGQNASSGGAGGSGSINGLTVGGNGGSGFNTSSFDKAGGYGAGGGGGGQSRGLGGSGGFAGGGGGSGLLTGGAGGDFGGGGGSIGNATGSHGGAGGFGCGGGGSGGGIDALSSSGGNGGNGGFGGGGGNAQRSDHGYTGGVSLYAGGTGGTGVGGCGGGGAALGGAVFYKQGGALTLDNCTFQDCFITQGLTAGTGGATNGSAYGTDMFIQSSSTCTFLTDVILRGTLHSDGDWTKDGVGTLHLLSNNSYAGSTNLAQGTIALQADQALGTGSLNMATGTILDLADGISIANNIETVGVANIFVDAGLATISGLFSGAAGFDKKGEGTLALQADSSSYTQEILVEAGTLKIDGTIGSNVTVSHSGVLGGHGVITGDVHIQAGTIIPDLNDSLAIDQLILSLESIMNETLLSTVKIRINEIGTSVIAVEQTASLSGILEFDLDPTTKPGNYIILTSSALVGTFDEVVFTSLTPDYTLSYLPTSGSPAYIEFNFLGYPASNFQVEQKKNNFGFQYELYNQLTWTLSQWPYTQGYILYRDGIEIAKVNALTNSYQDHNRQIATSYVYSLVAFDSYGNNSTPVVVTIS